MSGEGRRTPAEPFTPTPDFGPGAAMNYANRNTRPDATGVLLWPRLRGVAVLGTAAAVLLAGASCEGSDGPGKYSAPEAATTAPLLPAVPSAPESEAPAEPSTLGEWLATNPPEPECPEGVSTELITDMNWGDAVELKIAPHTDASLEGQNVVTIVNLVWDIDGDNSRPAIWSVLQPGTVSDGLAPAASVPVEELKEAVDNDGTINTYLTTVPANFMYPRFFGTGESRDGRDVLNNFPGYDLSTSEEKQISSMLGQCSRLTELDLEATGPFGSNDKFKAKEQMPTNE